MSPTESPESADMATVAITPAQLQFLTQAYKIPYKELTEKYHMLYERLEAHKGLTLPEAVLETKSESDGITGIKILDNAVPSFKQFDKLKAELEACIKQMESEVGVVFEVWRERMLDEEVESGEQLPAKAATNSGLLRRKGARPSDPVPIKSEEDLKDAVKSRKVI